MISDVIHVPLVDRATGIHINVQKTIESVPARRWRMMVVQTPGLHCSAWQWIYGTDIFLNGWPVLKIFAGLVLLGAWVITTL